MVVYNWFCTPFFKRVMKSNRKYHVSFHIRSIDWPHNRINSNANISKNVNTIETRSKSKSKFNIIPISVRNFVIFFVCFAFHEHYCSTIVVVFALQNCPSDRYICVFISSLMVNMLFYLYTYLYIYIV